MRGLGLGFMGRGLFKLVEASLFPQNLKAYFCPRHACERLDSNPFKPCIPDER